MIPALARPPHPSGYQMINSVSIRNFRCFSGLNIEGCRRVNIVVGDNATGKTALLEGMFLALGGSPQLGLRFRQQRGLDGTFAGTPRTIEDSIWRDLFFERNWNRPILVNLQGDGPEARAVSISRGDFEPTLLPDQDDRSALPLTFVWKDALGKEHKFIPQVTSSGVASMGIEEDLPDFFYFPSNQTISSVENATRLSEISRTRKLGEFVKIFTDEYKWIEDLGLEVVAGIPAIYASVQGSLEKYPLTNVSGGINRIIGVMLTIASRTRSVILVDEIENGVYHKHHTALWRALLSLVRNYDSQIIATTHNEEWLKGLVDAAGDNANDIALWRIQRENNRPVIHQFSGKQALFGIQAGEVR